MLTSAALALLRRQSRSSSTALGQQLVDSTCLTSATRLRLVLASHSLHLHLQTTNTQTERRRRMAPAKRSLEWESLDHTRFFLLNPTVFLVLRALQHPANVIKTRYMMQQKHALESSPWSTLQSTLRREGVRGLYRGFNVSVSTTILHQSFYISYEWLRSAQRWPSGVSEATRNSLASAFSVFLMQIISNPADVVAQRLMLQGRQLSNEPMRPVQPPSTAASVVAAPVQQQPAVLGTLDIARRVYAAHGLRGFWAGFWVSNAQFVPANLAWWSSYTVFRDGVWDKMEAAIALAKAVEAEAPAGGVGGRPATASAFDRRGAEEESSYGAPSASVAATALASATTSAPDALGATTPEAPLHRSQAAVAAAATVHASAPSTTAAGVPSVALAVPNELPSAAPPFVVDAAAASSAPAASSAVVHAVTSPRIGGVAASSSSPSSSAPSASSPSFLSAAPGRALLALNSVISPFRIAETVAGAAAGAFTAVLTNPLDIVRTRTQSEGLRAMPVVRTLLADEGIRGFWRGTTARLAMLVPHGALSIWAYESVKRWSLKRE